MQSGQATRSEAAAASWRLEPGGDGATLRLAGRLDAPATAELWTAVLAAVDAAQPARLAVDASELAYCDGSGAGLLVELARQQARRGAQFALERTSPDLDRLWRLIDVSEPPPAADAARPPLVRIGERTLRVGAGARAALVFTGQVLFAGLHFVRHPRQLRWRDVLLICEKVGANALVIILPIGSLLGLILAFEAANLMRRYGAEIYVADLVGVSVLRELGPLMTAVVLAGRSGSAFAAELGTMKINEELDALTTMGIDPQRFLVFPRVLAGALMMPLLTLFLNFFALLGGALVMRSIGFPFITYYNQVVYAVDLQDFLGGLFKASVLGVLVSAIGCLRGIQTKSGAAAVGDATTSAVVTGILAIAVADGIFSVLYFVLDI